MKSRLKENRFFKNILKLGFIIVGCFVLASFSPSLDGRAVVVESGVFPEGLFAKTVGYLPGDIISVTNITGDATIDILVIGALDPSEGVAIMLSPEAAAAIGINKDSNNIVKITKRSNQDERVYGSAVIASNDTAPAKETTPVAQPEPVKQQESELVKQPETVKQPEPEPVKEQEIVEEAWDEPVSNQPETISSVEPEEEIYSKPISEPVSEPVEEPVTEYEYFNDEALPEYSEEPVKEEETVPEYIEETPVVEEPQETAPVQEEQPVIYEEFKVDELDALPSEEEPVEEFETVPAEPVEEQPEEEIPEETPAEEQPVEPFEEEYSDDELEDVPAAEEEFFEEDSLDELEEEPVAEEEPPVEEEEPVFEEEEFGGDEPEEEAIEEEPVEEEPIEDEQVEDLPVEEVAEETPEEDWSDEPEVLDDDEEEYDAIVLVPADDNPPVYEEEDEDFAGVPEILNNTVSVYNNDEETEAPEITVNNSVVVQPASSGNETSYDKFVVESLNELEAEKYYIQIATLADDDNILEIVNKYGQKYPITIVPTAKGSKQVLIGPVTLDEYGTVLARFKAYGYKDAFLRKGTNPAPKARGNTNEKNIDAK